MVEKISDLLGLGSSCLYYPEKKIKATEDLCALDTPSADP